VNRGPSDLDRRGVSISTSESGAAEELDERPFATAVWGRDRRVAKSFELRHSTRVERSSGSVQMRPRHDRS